EALDGRDEQLPTLVEGEPPELARVRQPGVVALEAGRATGQHVEPLDGADEEPPRAGGLHLVDRLVARQPARPSELDDATRLLAEEPSAAREVQHARGVDVDRPDGPLARRARLRVRREAVLAADVEALLRADVQRAP